MVERCTGIAEVEGSNAVQSFRNCKSCVYNCDDLFSYNYWRACYLEKPCPKEKIQKQMLSESTDLSGGQGHSILDKLNPRLITTN